TLGSHLLRRFDFWYVLGHLVSFEVFHIWGMLPLYRYDSASSPFNVYVDAVSRTVFGLGTFMLLLSEARLDWRIHNRFRAILLLIFIANAARLFITDYSG